MTTGTSYLLQKMALKGTNSRSKTEIGEEIENMGARYSAKSDIEQTNYWIQVLKGDAGKAVGLLGY